MHKITHRLFHHGKPEHGDLATFGEALDRIGFWGASGINPNKMTNNCVSVSTARLLNYTNVDELWQATYGQALPDKPLGLKQVLDLLKKTGWGFQYKMFEPDDEAGRSALQVMQRGFSPDYPTAFMVLYLRVDGTGHAINATYDFNDWKTPVMWGFWDFQRQSRGEDRSDDVKTAVHIVVLELELPKDHKKGEVLWEEMKRREKALKSSGSYYYGYSLGSI
ncbi:hypothetical protein CMUS01_10458 [Colletotrichum musicola]|uniref:Uncharacterized protein n=1 Tax=Colletotrichum musicola TaxID=2175873 RepID=A0A8H6N951_9PEZI|nr:hypothetical protein CMUS01_10458 [Colletotrichum musicola]